MVLSCILIHISIYLLLEIVEKHIFCLICMQFKNCGRQPYKRFHTAGSIPRVPYRRFHTTDSIPQVPYHKFHTTGSIPQVPYQVFFPLRFYKYDACPLITLYLSRIFEYHAYMDDILLNPSNLLHFTHDLLGLNMVNMRSLICKISFKRLVK